MKLKLLFVTYTHSNGGGAENVLTTLVNNLRNEKYDISILEFIDYAVKKEPINGNIKLLPAVIKNKHYNKELEYLFCNHPKILKQVLNLTDYDIVITWNYQIPSFVLPAFVSEKKIAWFHSDIFDLQPETESYFKQQKVWDLADKIITISNKSLRSLESRFPQFMNRASIINNSIDVKKIIAMASVKLLDNLSFKDNNLPLLCFAGRLEYRKNQALLLDVLSYLIKDNFKCNLLLIGDGHKKAELEKQVKNLDITDYVLFAGFQSNPYPLINKADLMCLTSFSEGFPTVICEGMILGKPFVTTPVAGASEELADNGKCGLVAGYEPKKYAECIKSILENKNRYEDMSKHCKEHIKKFSIASTIINFDNLIDSLNIEAIRRVKKKSLAWTMIKFANVCVLSGIYNIKMSKKLFISKKSTYNFCKFSYYIIRALFMISFYPFFFINYVCFALKLRKKYAT